MLLQQLTKPPAAWCILIVLFIIIKRRPISAFPQPDTVIQPRQQNMSCRPVYTAAVYTSNMTGKLHTAFIGTVCIDIDIHTTIIIKSAL